jgi:hypothetical protein
MTKAEEILAFDRGAGGFYAGICYFPSLPPAPASHRRGGRSPVPKVARAASVYCHRVIIARIGWAAPFHVIYRIIA